MGSSAASLLRVAPATPPRPRDRSHSCSFCPAGGRAWGGRSYTEEDSAEVGAAAHREGGAAGIVQEDGGVLPHLRGRSGSAWMPPACRCAHHTPCPPRRAQGQERGPQALPSNPAPLTPGLVPPPQLHQPRHQWAPCSACAGEQASAQGQGGARASNSSLCGTRSLKAC